MSGPLVSVVMAARNADAFVDEAVSSILHQTYEHLELIAVDDGSDDETGDRLRAACKVDRRVTLLCNEKRYGQAASLNRALENARGELLARMDADDVAAPDRLALQISAFDADPDLVLLGSNVEHVSRDGRQIAETELPLDDWTIRCVAMSLNPFAHPSVMIRAKALDGDAAAYDTSFETTQDWELWTRLMARGRVANLRQPLLRQRRHADSVSATNRETQLANSLRVQERYVRQFLGPDLWVPDRFSRLNRVFYGDRRGADRCGLDRVAACRDALALLDAVGRRYPTKPSRRYCEFVVGRCVQMGLVPPVRRGAVGLALSLLSRYPGATLTSLVRLVVLRPAATN